MSSSNLIVSTLTRKGLSPRNTTTFLNVSPRNKKNGKIVNLDTPNRKKIINNNNFPQNMNHWIIGSGSFGIVYKAIFKGNLVAMKMINEKKINNKSAEREKNIKNLNHPNIVQIYLIEQSNFYSLVIMELCSSSLEDKLDESEISKVERVSIWKSIASAVNYCHGLGIIHADIKPKNILITSNGVLKLADFGSSLVIGDEKTTPNSLHGTPGYVAPEVIKGNCPTIQSDLFSLGILGWQLLSKQKPFAGYHVHTIIYITGKGQRPLDSHLDDGFNGDYQILYQKLWSQDPKSRPILNYLIDKLNYLLK